jgi:hypothetical protein
MRFVEKLIGTKININIYFSLCLLFLGFVTQFYIKNNFGFEIFGISVLIRTMNSETFYSFVDLGIGEELLFENRINKVGFYIRIVLTFFILFLFTFNIGFISEDLNKYCNILFFMMCSSFLLFLNKSYYKKINKIIVIRIIDIINSVVFILTYIYTTDLYTVLMLLGVTNLVLFLASFKVDIMEVFNLTNSSFSILKSSSYYITSLSAKLEGSILALVIPAISSTELLGKFDLITKIPKAFKSQLGEFNSLKKYDFLYNNSRSTNSNYQSNNLLVLVLSMVVLILTIVYLYLLKINFSTFYLFIIISELYIGIFLNKYNIQLIELFIDTKNRMRYVFSSFLRSIMFIFIVFMFKNSMDFEFLMILWYATFFLFFFFLSFFFFNK